jgi:hypothetical protein
MLSIFLGPPQLLGHETALLGSFLELDVHGVDFGFLGPRLIQGGAEVKSQSSQERGRPPGFKIGHGDEQDEKRNKKIKDDPIDLAHREKSLIQVHFRDEIRA